MKSLKIFFFTILNLFSKAFKKKKNRNTDEGIKKKEETEKTDDIYPLW